jgi:hypothetical protein
MEIYGLYYSIFISLQYVMGIRTLQSAYAAVFIAVGVWLALFILQGVGMYTMAKKQGVPVWKLLGYKQAYPKTAYAS